MPFQHQQTGEYKHIYKPEFWGDFSDSCLTTSKDCEVHFCDECIGVNF